MDKELILSRQQKYAVSLVNLSEEELRLSRQLAEVKEQMALTRGALAELAALLREDTDEDGNQAG